MGVSGNLWIVVKDVRPLVVYIRKKKIRLCILNLQFTNFNVAIRVKDEGRVKSI